MDNTGGLAVYVTSHGFGHHNRTVAVLNRIPADVPIVIRCAADLHPAWRERLTRPVRLEAAVWDCGTIHPPGNSLATDRRATFERARAVHAEGLRRLPEETERLVAEHTACVLCDIPPLPLVAARRAGIPAYLLANFTWSQVFSEHAEGVEDRRFVEDLALCYSRATAAFRAQPALALRAVQEVIDVGLVANAGRDRRIELCDRLGIHHQDKLIYFYVGRYGQCDLDWPRLAEYRCVHFISLHAPPVEGLPNMHVVAASDWSGADLTASTDAAFAKAGYGSTSEAMASRKPLIYPPRRGFAEHTVLDQALRAWGGGIALTQKEFTGFQLGHALGAALSQRPGAPPYAIDGARRVAQFLTEACRGLDQRRSR